MFCFTVNVAQESTSVSVKPDLSEGKCVIIARTVLLEDGGGLTQQQSAITDAPPGPASPVETKDTV